MKIKVTKTTGVEKLRKANSFTSGKDSKMSLATAYRLGHSPIRTQRFDVEMYEIPLFVASQFVRSNLGVNWYMSTKRVDRGAMDFRKTCEIMSCNLRTAYEDNDDEWMLITADQIDELTQHFDRYAPTNLYAEGMNAEALMNYSRKRLCSKASKEARDIFTTICELVEEQDPDLYPWLVPPCVMYGFCREHKPCGYWKTPQGIAERENIISLCEVDLK